MLPPPATEVVTTQRYRSPLRPVTGRRCGLLRRHLAARGAVYQGPPRGEEAPANSSPPPLAQTPTRQGPAIQQAEHALLNSVGILTLQNTHPPITADPLSEAPTFLRCAATAHVSTHPQVEHASRHCSAPRTTCRSEMALGSMKVSAGTRKAAAQGAYRVPWAFESCFAPATMAWPHAHGAQAGCAARMHALRTILVSMNTLTALQIA